MSTRVRLNGVRAYWLELFTPKQYEGKGAFRYDGSFLVEPGSENDKKTRAAIKKEADDKFGKKSEVMLQSFSGNSNKFCYINGDMKDDERCKGTFVLASHRSEKKGPPLVIDRNKARLVEKDGRPYSGCYVNCDIDIYCQDGTNAGVRAALVAVQFAKDGDAFAGGAPADPDSFEDLGDTGEGEMEGDSAKTLW
jgi:hypothetical protein